MQSLVDSSNGGCGYAHCSDAVRIGTTESCFVELYGGDDDQANSISIKVSFFYDDEVESVPVEAVNVKDASINEVLEKALAGKDISYRIDENVVYLSKRESESSSVKQEGKKTKQVSGRIVDANGEPLVGVSVLEKGTTNGTITDFDGNYTLTVPENATLQFSYIGYKSTEMPVSGQASINLTMREDSEILDEVVVTALGIKRAEKALSYNVQEVKSDAITTNKDVNFVNALSGKVAGVNINASSSGVGGISKVVMRGTKSIMQSSNALYVIDGVPMFTGRSSEGGGTEFDSKVVLNRLRTSIRKISSQCLC